MSFPVLSCKLTGGCCMLGVLIPRTLWGLPPLILAKYQAPLHGVMLLDPMLGAQWKRSPALTVLLAARG